MWRSPTPGSSSSPTGAHRCFASSTAPGACCGAVDAAVAIQAVLGLVEPQSSGLGGGAFMLVYDARARQIRAYDGREEAPADAPATLFLDAGGKPIPVDESVIAGRATGVEFTDGCALRGHRRGVPRDN